MVTIGALMKSVMVAVVLVGLAGSGLAGPGEKVAECCKSVSNEEITEPITGYMVQRPKLPCVLAVIFQTENGLFCSNLRAPWVRRKIAQFEKEKKQVFSTPSPVRSSTPSLLSMITSTTSPSSAPSSSSSHSSTS